MPETPEEFHRRVASGLRVPPVGEWDSWPFEGELRVRELRPPRARAGHHGRGRRRLPGLHEARRRLPLDRRALAAAVDAEPTGLPVVVLLEPRAHHASPADLPEELAREQGVMLGRVERAVLAVGGIGKVHIGRWGEGAEHLHWWFIAAPGGPGPAAQLVRGDLGRGAAADPARALGGQPRAASCARWKRAA